MDNGKYDASDLNNVVCSICAGSGKNLDGSVCVCGGSGSICDELHGLRKIAIAEMANTDMLQNVRRTLEHIISSAEWDLEGVERGLITAPSPKLCLKQNLGLVKRALNELEQAGVKKDEKK